MSRGTKGGGWTRPGDRTDGPPAATLTEAIARRYERPPARVRNRRRGRAGFCRVLPGGAGSADGRAAGDADVEPGPTLRRFGRRDVRDEVALALVAVALVAVALVAVALVAVALVAGALSRWTGGPR